MNRKFSVVTLVALVCTSTLQAAWHDEGPYMWATDKVAVGAEFSPITDLHLKGGDAKLRIEGTVGAAIQMFHNSFGFEWQTYSDRMRLNKVGPITRGDIMVIREYGSQYRLGLGTHDPAAKLDVVGDVKISGKIILKNNWTLEAPDYVFDNSYQLRSLAEVEKHINEEKHLPEIPSAAEIKENGVDLTEMNMLLLKKVEELTLYVIEQNKKIESLEDRVNMN